VIKDRIPRHRRSIHGGSESFADGFDTLDEFAWIGLSVPSITEAFDIEFPEVDSKTTKQLHCFGLLVERKTDDDVSIVSSRLARIQKYQHADIETPGAHT